MSVHPVYGNSMSPEGRRRHIVQRYGYGDLPSDATARMGQYVSRSPRCMCLGLSVPYSNVLAPCVQCARLICETCVAKREGVCHLCAAKGA